MKLNRLLFFVCNCFLVCNLYAQADLFLPSRIEEYDWTLNDWTKVSDKDLIYYQDGKTKHYDKYSFNADASELKEIVDYDTITRVTNLLVLYKADKNSSYINNYQGKNCYVDFFNTCGNSGENWISNKWVPQYGRRNQPILSNESKLTGIIWEEWNNNRQEWLPTEKEEFIRDANQILTEKIVFNWNQNSQLWIKKYRLYFIKLIPGRPTLFESYLKQLWNGTEWIDSERYKLELNGKTAYKDLKEKFENNNWVPVSRNQLFINGDLNYERYINNKWIVIETQTLSKLFDHHQRYGVIAAGDSIEKHFHKRWYDEAKNTLHYTDYTNTSGSIVYYEENNDMTYNSDGFLDYYILNSRTSENGIYEKKKKFVYSKYVNVVTGFKESGSYDDTYLQIYPNPSSNGIFQLKSSLSTSDFTIHNLQGELVTAMSAANNMVVLNSLPNGTYIFTMGKMKKMISIMK